MGLSSLTLPPSQLTFSCQSPSLVRNKGVQCMYSWAQAGLYASVDSTELLSFLQLLGLQSCFTASSLCSVGIEPMYLLKWWLSSAFRCFYSKDSWWVLPCQYWQEGVVAGRPVLSSCSHIPIYCFRNEAIDIPPCPAEWDKGRRWAVRSRLRDEIEL